MNYYLQAREIINYVIENNLIKGAVLAFLKGETSVLPRSWLRGVTPVNAAAFALFGLSLWQTAKLLQQLTTIIRNHRDRYVNVDIPRGEMILEDDGQVVDLPEFNGNLIYIVNRDYRYWMVLFYLVSGISIYWPNLICLLLSFIVLIKIFRARLKYVMVSESHYVDLVSYGYGRQCNSALFHTLRSRLYNRFWKQRVRTMENNLVFINTLNQSFAALKRSERHW